MIVRPFSAVPIFVNSLVAIFNPAVKADASIVATPRPSFAAAEFAPNVVLNVRIKSLLPSTTNVFAVEPVKSILFAPATIFAEELTVTVSIPLTTTLPASIPAALVASKLIL